MQGLSYCPYKSPYMRSIDRSSCTKAKEGHPYRNFGWGNLKSLKDRPGRSGGVSTAGLELRDLADPIAPATSSNINLLRALTNVVNSGLPAAPYPNRS